MEMKRKTYFILLTLCLWGISFGRSMEKEEEKTNAINEEGVEAEVSTAASVEPEAEAETTEGGVTEAKPEAEAETTEIDVTTESGTTTEPTTRQPEECNPDPYCK